MLELLMEMTIFKSESTMKKSSNLVPTSQGKVSSPSPVDAYLSTLSSDGSRRVTHVTECVGMEQDMVTLQDIFLFEKTGVAESGRVLGRFRATGIRPKFYDRFKASGINLPPHLFQTVVEIN